MQEFKYYPLTDGWAQLQGRKVKKIEKDSCIEIVWKRCKDRKQGYNISMNTVLEKAECAIIYIQVLRLLELC